VNRTGNLEVETEEKTVADKMPYHLTQEKEKTTCKE
jgi:hypothetical protein